MRRSFVCRGAPQGLTATPQAAGSTSVIDNRFTFNLPAMSVTTLELAP